MEEPQIFEFADSPRAAESFPRMNGDLRNDPNQYIDLNSAGYSGASHAPREQDDQNDEEETEEDMQSWSPVFVSDTSDECLGEEGDCDGVGAAERASRPRRKPGAELPGRSCLKQSDSSYYGSSRLYTRIGIICHFCYANLGRNVHDYKSHVESGGPRCGKHFLKYVNLFRLTCLICTNIFVSHSALMRHVTKCFFDRNCHKNGFVSPPFVSGHGEIAISTNIHVRYIPRRLISDAVVEPQGVTTRGALRRSHVAESASLVVETTTTVADSEEKEKELGKRVSREFERMELDEVQDEVESSVCAPEHDGDGIIAPGENQESADVFEFSFDGEVKLKEAGVVPLCIDAPNKSEVRLVSRRRKHKSTISRQKVKKNMQKSRNQAMFLPTASQIEMYKLREVCISVKKIEQKSKDAEHPVLKVSTPQRRSIRSKIGMMHVHSNYSRNATLRSSSGSRTSARGASWQRQVKQVRGEQPLSFGKKKPEEASSRSMSKRMMTCVNKRSDKVQHTKRQNSAKYARKKKVKKAAQSFLPANQCEVTSRGIPYVKIVRSPKAERIVSAMRSIEQDPRLPTDDQALFTTQPSRIISLTVEEIVTENSMEIGRAVYEDSSCVKLRSTSRKDTWKLSQRDTSKRITGLKAPKSLILEKLLTGISKAKTEKCKAGRSLETVPIGLDRDASQDIPPPNLHADMTKGKKDMEELHAIDVRSQEEAHQDQRTCEGKSAEALIAPTTGSAFSFPHPSEHLGPLLVNTSPILPNSSRPMVVAESEPTGGRHDSALRQLREVGLPQENSAANRRGTGRANLSERPIYLMDSTIPLPLMRGAAAPFVETLGTEAADKVKIVPREEVLRTAKSEGRPEAGDVTERMPLSPSENIPESQEEFQTQ